MSVSLPATRFDASRHRFPNAQQPNRARDVNHRPGDGGLMNESRDIATGSIIMRAATSRRSLAVADTVQAAQAAFAEGEFQPEAFSRTLCLLVDALEGHDNALRLCAARLLERFRPYLASNPISVEVAQRVAAVLGHEDPIARELALDVLSVVVFAVGGLPPSILRSVDRSLRSPFLPEREAAARAYASCLYLHRLCDPDRVAAAHSLQWPSSSASSPSSPLPSSPFSSSSSSLTVPSERSSFPVSLSGYPRSLAQMAALASALMPAVTWDDPTWVTDLQSGLYEESGPSARTIGALLESILLRLDGGLPSQELWECAQAFVLAWSTIRGSPKDENKGGEGLVRHALQVIISCLTGPTSRALRSPAAVRSAAVNFVVALLKTEHASAPLAQGDGTGSVVQMLVDAAERASHVGQSVELVLVLSAPAVAEAALKAATVKPKSDSRTSASEPGGGKRIKGRTTSLSVVGATIRKLRGMCSASSTASTFGRLSWAASLALFSIAIALYRAAGGESMSRQTQEKLLTLGRFATDGILESRPVVRVLAGKSPADECPSELSDARVVLSKLRTLATTHPAPRERIALGAARRLARAATRDVLVEDLAVLLSHVMVTIAWTTGDRLENTKKSKTEKVEKEGKAKSGDTSAPDSPPALLWAMLFGRRFARTNPKAVVGIAVALMRVHQGSLARQSTLSAALVKAMGTCTDEVAGNDDQDSSTDGSASELLVEDPWFQLLLCRECMLHGFHQAAEAGLRRLRDGAAGTCDTIWGWTEVLVKVSTAEAFYGGSTDQVAAHACAAHEIRFAAESLSLVTRPGARRRPPRFGRDNDMNVNVNASGNFHPVDDFSFQRSFLQARVDLLQLLGASRAICKELSPGTKGRYPRYSRREARCRRLPAAFRRVARDFRNLRGMRPGAGPTTSEPLRAASSLCLLLAIACDLLLNMSKNILTGGSKDKGGMRKKSWRTWLERLQERSCEPSEEDGVGAQGVQSSPMTTHEGVLMRAVRLWGSRLLNLNGTPNNGLTGRAGFVAILDTLRGIPFPMPRAFFRTGGGPRVSLFVFPPAPSNATPISDGTGKQDPGDGLSHAPGGTYASSMLTRKRQRETDPGLGEYHGPSCQMRAERAQAELSRRPPLPLMGPAKIMARGGGDKGSVPARESGASNGDAVNGAGASANGAGRDPWLPSELWWSQLAKEDSSFPEPRGRMSLSGYGTWRVQAPQAVQSPRVWLMQGCVCRGRGAGGALPRVSEVVLGISLKFPPNADGGTGVESSDAQGGSVRPNGTSKPWSSTKVVADVFGAEADEATAICFRAEVPLPSLQGVRGINVVVFLRRRNATVGSYGEAVIAATLPDKANRSTRTLRASGHEELWRVGSISIPVPSAMNAF